MNRPRIILADSRRLLREVLAALLSAHCDVVETVANGQDLVAAAVALKPDVVVLETELPTLDGLVAGRQIKALVPQVKLVYLIDEETPTAITNTFRSGASGLLLSNSTAVELGEAIDAVTRGRVYVTPAVRRITGCAASIARRWQASHKAELGPWRRQVLRLLAEGYSKTQVARILKITPRIVALHEYGIVPAAGLRSGAKPTRIAIGRQRLPA